MFNWFHSAPAKTAVGIGKIKADFIEMLQTARAEFLLSCQVSIYGRPADEVREETIRLDKKVNKAERMIRKELVVHCSVRGQIDPECLIFMSIAKDAERLGDYSKNIFDMGELSPILPEGQEKEELILLKLSIHKIFDRCVLAIQQEDEEAARQIIIECKWLGEQCDEITKRLVNLAQPTPRTASDVLMFRFMKRMTAHLRNICSSIVQPVHKLDFTKKITREADMRMTLLERKTSMAEEFEAELRENANFTAKE